MLKAILKRTWREEISGATGTQYLTVDFDAPEVEAQMRRGGLNETGFEVVELLGIEVLNPLPTPDKETE